MRFLLLLWIAAVTVCIPSSAQDAYVFVNTNGVVQFPVNLWAANSNDIVQAIGGAFPGGGGGGSGTVTSVNASGGTTGLSFSGVPITGSGTMTLSGTLNAANIDPAMATDAELAAHAATTNAHGASLFGALLSAQANAAGVRSQLGIGSIYSHSETDYQSTNSALTKLQGGNGGDLTTLNAGSLTGQIAMARMATGTPNGTKFVRDDGTLATPVDNGGVVVGVAVSNIANSATITWTTTNGVGYPNLNTTLLPKTIAHWTAKDYIPNAANSATFSSRSVGGSLVPSITFLPDVQRGTSFEAAMPAETIDLSAGVNVKLFWSTPLASAGSNVVFSVTVTNICCGNTANATTLITNAPSGVANEVTNHVVSFPTLTNLTQQGMVKVFVDRVAGSASDANPLTNEVRAAHLYVP